MIIITSLILVDIFIVREVFENANNILYENVKFLSFYCLFYFMDEEEFKNEVVDVMLYHPDLARGQIEL